MFRGSLFVIQVGAGVASGAALRRSAFVYVSSRLVRGRLGGACLFVIQVGAGAVSKAALSLSALVCVCVASLCVRVRFLPGSPRSRFPAAGRAKRAQRAVRAKRPRCSKDKTGTNTVASRSAVTIPLARVVKIICVRVLLLLCVRVSVSMCAGAPGPAKVWGSCSHALGRPHKFKRASRSLSNAGFQFALLSRARV